MAQQKPDSRQDDKQKAPETIEQGHVVRNEQEAKEMLELHKREEAQRDDMPSRELPAKDAPGE